MRGVHKIALIAITGLALFLTACSYLVNTWPYSPLELRPIYDLLGIIQWPADLAGFLVSGNVHIPDSFTIYLVLFATYWLFVGFAVWFVLFVMRRRRESGDRKAT
jgi:hypothetical protein